MALWQIPIFSAVIIGNLILDRLLLTHSLPQLIRLALWPFCLGLLALIGCALSGASLGAVVASLALYAVGLGMSNAALYRLALFASDDSKGLVSAHGRDDFDCRDGPRRLAHCRRSAAAHASNFSRSWPPSAA